MYRPPEMCDLYLGYQVNEKVDIWMLGCVLYTLCFFKHPFVDGQKLGISQAQYTIPNQSTYSAKLMDLIRHMLTPDPVCRPSSLDILNILINWNRIQQIPLNKMAQEIKEKQLKQEMEENSLPFNQQHQKYNGGDIPMSELMKLASKIKSEKEDDTTFIKPRSNPV